MKLGKQREAKLWCVMRETSPTRVLWYHGHSTREGLHIEYTRFWWFLKNCKQMQRNDTSPVENVRYNYKQTAVQPEASAMFGNWRTSSLSHQVPQKHLVTQDANSLMVFQRMMLIQAGSKLA
jgi:hypothetical protein